MTSEIKEIPTLGEDNVAPELTKIQDAARLELIRAFEKLSPSIDALSSANLKRVLKFTTGYAEVNHLLTGKQPNLSDDEKKLVDDILDFRSTLYGFYAILKESNEANEIPTTEETTDE